MSFMPNFKSRVGRPLILSCALVAIAGCTHRGSAPNETSAPLAVAAPETSAPGAGRQSGAIGAPRATPSSISIGRAPGEGGLTLSGGDVSLDFADADLRDTAGRILGDLLHVNYTIDPDVKGTVSLRTAQPVPPAQALDALRAVLAQNNAVLVVEGGLYHVETAAGGSTPGGEVVPLRYAAAADLAKALAPFVGDNLKIGTASGLNALVISGDPAAREALQQTIDAFDVDSLAGQSYALLPVAGGGAREYAQALEDALDAANNGALADTVRVAPLARLNAVLVIAHSQAAIAAAERVQRLFDQQNANTLRSWHVIYLQNSRADDVVYLLQQAFTPDHVTTHPVASNQSSSASTMGATSSSNGSSGSETSAANSLATPQTTTPAAPASGAANPVQGGTDNSNSSDNSDSDQGNDATAHMRIISDPQNEAVMIYATGAEEDTVEAMLRKIDVVPLQVRIDATIAEVTLNDNLQFGTQYFFKSAGPLTSSTGGINSYLASAFSGSNAVTGFVLAGSGASQAALEALQNVTKVRVLSSPEVMALDNQQATLQVGDLVPTLTSSSQSTVANSAVINSIEYHQTGVMLEVTPHVDAGGKVTLDLVQNVSDVDSALTTPGINSPSFQQRSVRTRVVVQDGQTVGVAGLIRDNVSTGNQGVPYLKDVPILGGLLGQQANTRTRTELLVLITPHVMSDERSIDALTADLRDQLRQAAAVPGELARLRPSGSEDPNHSSPALSNPHPGNSP